MGFEVLFTGTVLFVGSLMLLLILHLDAVGYLEDEEPFYFMIHPRLFQMIFYLMFWAFPINFGIVALQHTDTINIQEASGVITLIFLLWPTFTYFPYRSFIGLSLKLGMSAGLRIEYDPVFIEQLKFAGWIGSILSFVTFFFIKLLDIVTILEDPLFFFAMFGLVLLLPSRKSLAIIRGKQVQENTRD
ncbi:MAG: hypothetical protein OEV85_04465 [Candidatus Thorarchaeota archaeon]|nr:hypothetical protein [Candidatus Thorarchaeota archaeon]